MKSSMDVENEVLAAILYDSSECSYAFEVLKPEYFVDKIHGSIFAEMVRLYEAGDSIDSITLSEHQRFEDDLIDIQSISFTTNNIRSHSNILMDRWYLLEARTMLLDAVKSLDDPGRTPEALRARCEEAAYFLSDRVRDKGLQHISKIAGSTMDQLEQIQLGNFPGVMTGFTKFDEMGFYFRKKTLSVIAARPGQGKSAFALKIARNCPGNVVIYSMEMSGEEQYERLISIETGLTNDDLRNKEMLKGNNLKIIDSTGVVNKHNIWINDSTRTTIPMIGNQCKRMGAQNGLDLIIVDYMGLLKSDRKFQQRNEEVGYLSQGLKNIANELDVPVIALSQLNRKLEERTNKRPILSDLRSSGDIEQDAHMVWFLYRGETYGEENVEGEVEVIVAKNRSGKTGTEKLTFIKESTDFVDYKPPESVRQQSGMLF